MRKLYDWIISLSGSPHAWWALAAVAFVESSFFPIPPDVLLVPLVLANRRRAFQYALVATVASVIGGYLGYGIGYFAFESIGKPILQTFAGGLSKFNAMKDGFDHYGVWIIIVKGMTPIPYKLLTIASGVFKFDLLQFTVASLISRSLRFFLVAALLWKFGEPIRTFIEERLMLVTTAFAVALVGGVVVLAVL